MAKKVLIVENDRELLGRLKKELAKYSKAFSPVLADSVNSASKLIKNYPISLMVIDLETLQKDGKTFLSRLKEGYPDIQTIAITNQAQTLDEGSEAAGHLNKPFATEDLAKLILDMLRNEASGGILRGAAPGTFLQLVEMEQKTCCIRLTDEQTAAHGVLFFLEGELLDARFGELRGRDAGYKILAWEEATMAIQESCPVSENKVQADLQAILLEAMRLKDEDERASDTKMSQEEIDEYILSESEEKPEQEFAVEVDETEEVFEEEQPVTPVSSESQKKPDEKQPSGGMAKTFSSKSPAVSYSLADSVVGTMTNLKDAVFGSAIVRYTFRFFVLFALVCLGCFSYLYLTMENDKALTVQIDQAKASIRSKQESLFQLDKEIDELYTKRESSIKSNDSQAVIMDYDLKISELEERQEKLQAESDNEQKTLEEWQVRLEAIKRKSLYKRLFERAGEILSK